MGASWTHLALDGLARLRIVPGWCSVVGASWTPLETLAFASDIAYVSLRQRDCTTQLTPDS
eukprot:8785135-Pyramimonas_sp.AAC.1